MAAIELNRWQTGEVQQKEDNEEAGPDIRGRRHHNRGAHERQATPGSRLFTRRCLLPVIVPTFRERQFDNAQN